ncbi:MAG: Rid family hydrolase [Pseudomonadota bacterium]
MKQYSWPDDHWGWPVELTHQHGVRCNDLVFTGGQADLDKNGAANNTGALEPQVDNVIRFVDKILQDLNASMSNIVRWVVYFVGNTDDEALILSALNRATPATCQPSVSTICLPELCYPGMRIELEAVAWCPAPQRGLKPQFARGANLPMLPEGFSHAVRCDNLIFTSDCSALSSTGRVREANDLIAQTQIMMDCLESTLALVGAVPDDVLKINVFYEGDGTAENWSAPALIRADRFNEPGPAATGITVDGFATPGLMTKMAVTAGVSHAAGQIEYAWPAGHWDWSEKLPYKHGNRFGNLIHLGGQVALDQHAVVLHPDDVVRQTTIAMKNIELVLAEFGATLDDVVKVTTFYQGSSSAEALHENLLIRSRSYNKPGPSTSGIPVTRLVYESMVIEIEVIAMLDA